MNTKEESLKNALTTLRIPELPKRLKEEDEEYWMEAIVLVRKMDSTQSYALAKRRADGRICYTSDFGSMSPIAGLIAIYPYLYLDKDKYLSTGDIDKKREKLIQFIGGDDDAKIAVSGMSDEEVENAILSIAVDTQNMNSSIIETHKSIIESVKGKPVEENADNEIDYMEETQETSMNKDEESGSKTKKKITRRSTSASCKSDK